MKIYCSRNYSIDSLIGEDIWVYLQDHKMWCKVISKEYDHYVCDILRGRVDMMRFMQSMPYEYRVNTLQGHYIKNLRIEEFKDDFEKSIRRGEFHTTAELFGLEDLYNEDLH